MILLKLSILDSLYPKDVMPHRKEGLRIRRPRISKAKMEHITSKAFQGGLLSQLNKLK